MTWLWIVLAVVAAIVVIPTLVGLLLPAEYSGRVRARFGRPAADVFAVLNDPDRVRVTGHMCRGSERLPDQDGLPCWREDMGRSAITVRTRELDPPGRIVRELEDSVVPMRATVEIRIEATDGGCVVEVAQHLRIDRGSWHVPIFRFTMWAFGGARMGPKMWLRTAAQSLDESVAIEVPRDQGAQRTGAA